MLVWYQVYIDLLAPYLIKLYTGAMKDGRLPFSMVEVLIVVLPKPGKDKLLFSFYRPISLLTCDIKVLAKLLSLRLNRVILSVVHPDQIGL